MSDQEASQSAGQSAGQSANGSANGSANQLMDAPRARLVGRCNRLRLLIVAAILSLLAPATLSLGPPRASAHSPFGLFPTALSTGELSRLLDSFVHARQEQWDAIETALDAYQSDFAALRRGPMQEVLDAAAALDRTPDPPVGDRVDMRRRIDRINARIKSLDERLLERIAVLLDDDQLVGLPRVREARERQRSLDSGVRMWIGGRTLPDLSQMTLTLALTPDERAAVDPLLLTYESAATRLAVEIATAAATVGETFSDSIRTRMVERAAHDTEALDQPPIADAAEEDEAQRALVRETIVSMTEVMEQSWDLALRDLRGATGKYRKLNHNTLPRLVEQLDESHGRELRRRFIRAGYPTVAPIDPPAEAIFRTILRRDLSEADRTMIEAAMRDYLAADARLVDELIASDDRAQQRQSPMGGPAMNEHMETIRDVMQKRMTLAEAARTSVQQSLPVPTGGAAAGHSTIPDAGPNPGAALVAGDGSIDAARAAELREHLAHLHEQQTGSSRDPFVPMPIDVIELGRWTSRMTLDSDARSTLHLLHSDYLVEWEREVAPRIDRIREVFTERVDARGQRILTGGEREFELVARLRTDAIKAAKATDEAFFASTRAAVAIGDDIGRFELFALARALMPPASRMSDMQFQSNREPIVNIVTTLVDAPETTDMLPLLETILLEHDAPLRSTHDALLAAMREHDRIGRTLRAILSEHADDPTERMTQLMRFTPLAESASERLHAAAIAKRDVHRRILETIHTALTEERASTLQLAYRRAAWPTVYRESLTPVSTIESILNSASGTSDNGTSDNGGSDNGGSGSLTDAQREAIEETLQTLRVALEDIRERMIELFDQPLVANSTSGEMVATWLAQQREFSDLRREQTEASARAARRVLGQIEGDRERSAAALRRFLQ